MGKESQWVENFLRTFSAAFNLEKHLRLVFDTFEGTLNEKETKLFNKSSLNSNIRRNLLNPSVQILLATNLQSFRRSEIRWNSSNI